MIDYPNKLNIIFDKLDYFKIKPIIIGGYIRDKLLNLDSKDIDIELYGINSLKKLEKLLKEFGEINSVGQSFAVCKLKFNDLDLDFSLPRIDSKHSKGHKGFNVTIDSSLDFKTASSRRDFTMNAIGYDVKEKTLLDPFHGQEDIQNRIIRAVDLSKFGEDPLRILRAVQFSARFNFQLDNKLFDLCKQMIYDGALEELAQERILEEIYKLLLKSLTPSIGFTLLKRLDIFVSLCDSLKLQRIDYFASQKTTNDKTDILIFFSLLYDEISKETIYKLIREKNLLKDITLFYQNLAHFSFENLTSFDIYLLATKVNIRKFSYLLDAYYLGAEKEGVALLVSKAESLGVIDEKAKPILQGRDLIALGLTPSKKFSQILDAGYIAQMQSVFRQHTQAIEWLKNQL